MARSARRGSGLLGCALIVSMGLAAPQALAHGIHAPQPNAQPAATPDDKAEPMESALREFIRKNPDRVSEVLAEFERAQAEAKLERMASLRPTIESAAGGFGVGPSEAKVTVVDFFDYHCPACKRATSDVLALMHENPDVRFVFKEMPVLRTESRLVSRAALAARGQGKYVDFHVALMATPGLLSEKRVLEVAHTVGLDVEQLKAAMAAPGVDEEITNNVALAESLEIEGAPAFFVNGEFMPGRDLEKLSKMIADARKASVN